MASFAFNELTNKNNFQQRYFTTFPFDATSWNSLFIAIIDYVYQNISESKSAKRKKQELINPLSKI